MDGMSQSLSSALEGQGLQWDAAFACADVSIKENKDFVQRIFTVNGEIYIENTYCDEPVCEIVYRRLYNGADIDVERVVALRTQPLQLEFNQRNATDGFRAQWGLPEAAALGCVAAWAREAKCMEGEQPTKVGYSIASDLNCGSSYDSHAAVGQSIKEPWRVIDVDQTSCSVEDRDGYILRKMKLSATGENVVERITLNEESGTVTYNKCAVSGKPGDVERVLAYHAPLRLELCDRSACSGLRVDWKAPYDMAKETRINRRRRERRSSRRSLLNGF